ncbi:nucleotidyltransferase family protein [Caulobacter sp. S45]|uniref:nucleotidyltransferase family protein n=1 Tax=Caulobacter sp. S45 TaxID=1641861 RepID=UPI0020B15C19|nr:nucleotidyltransferase family protein [Caulobacter sp. S45]
MVDTHGQEALGDLLRHNRLAVLMARGLARDMTLPDRLKTIVAESRTLALQFNSRNLLTIRTLAPMLSAASIPFVVIKGPLAQQLAYGDFFAKPSSDVDVLVSNEVFVSARNCVLGAGYELPEPCASPWWRIFLGEQHLLTDNVSLATVDLHHRTQQPGCPTPRRPALFLTEPHLVRLGEIEVPILSKINAILLACVSVAKALVHREPAGGYAADIAAQLLALSPLELQGLFVAAIEQRLSSTLHLGLRAAALMFGICVQFPKTPRVVLDAISDRGLLSMLLTPAADDVGWPKRRALLWALCDAKFQYPVEVGWALSSEICRRIYNAGEGE